MTRRRCEWCGREQEAPRTATACRFCRAPFPQLGNALGMREARPMRLELDGQTTIFDVLAGSSPAERIER